MNNAVLMYRTPSMVSGAAGCVSALCGIAAGAAWWSDRSWGWFWVAFGFLAVGAVVSWIGYRQAVSVADYILPTAGLIISTLGLVALVAAALVVLADEDDSDSTTPRLRRRRSRRYRRRPRRRYRRRR